MTTKKTKSDVDSKAVSTDDQYFEFAVKKLDRMANVRISYTNTAYGGFGPQGEQTNEYQCHRYMASLHHDTKIVFSKFSNSCHDQKAGEAWVEWITSSESPWKICMDLGMSFRDEKAFNPDFWRTRGFIFDKLNEIPANVLMQFLITSRQAQEHPYLVSQWHSYVKAGLSPDMALVMTSCFSSSNQVLHGNLGDWMLDAASGTEQMIRNFLNHEMDKTVFIHSYSRGHSYTPVNALWGQEAPYNDRRTYTRPGCYGHADGYTTNMKHCILGQLYSNDFGEVVKNSSFGSNTCTWNLKSEEIIEIGRAEEVRLSRAS